MTATTRSLSLSQLQTQQGGACSVECVLSARSTRIAMSRVLSAVLSLALLSLLALPSCAALVTRADIVRSFPSARTSRYRRALTATNHHSASHTAHLSVALTPSDAAPPPAGLWLPTDFGADPTGAADSSPAFDLLLHSLLSVNRSHRLASGILDLGGATIDLQGGDYLISRPIVIPFCYGNVRMQRGTVRASSAFPASSSLLLIGNGSTELCDVDEQATSMENVAVSDVMFDGQQYAAECITIRSIMGAVLGPDLFFLGFTRAGVSVQGGHEVQIENSWLGQFVYSDPRKENGTAIGIELIGNDHVVNNVVVYSALHGIYVRGAANLIYNAHTWNDATGTGNGGLGIYMDCAGYTQNRVVASYLDYNDMLIVDPEHLLVTDCFFLGGGAVRLKASNASHRINGLIVRDNMFDVADDGSPAIKLDESEAQFTSLVDCVIDGNMLDSNYRALTTRVTRRFEFESDPSAPSYCFDLRDSLLFPQFNATSVQVTLHTSDASVVPSLVVAPGRASGVAADDRRSVCVVTSPIKTAGIQLAVDVTVDQSQYTVGQHAAAAAHQRRAAQRHRHHASGM